VLREVIVLGLPKQKSQRRALCMGPAPPPPARPSAPTGALPAGNLPGAPPPTPAAFAPRACLKLNWKPDANALGTAHTPTRPAGIACNAVVSCISSSRLAHRRNRKSGQATRDNANEPDLCLSVVNPFLGLNKSELC
jgi:hypothetical protein